MRFTPYFGVTSVTSDSHHLVFSVDLVISCSIHNLVINQILTVSKSSCKERNSEVLVSES